jgi:hypothetical protein
MTTPDETDETALRPSAGDSTHREESRFTPGLLIADRYRIIAPLGRGGMGEVYRADDIKLGQQVALKFLPQHVGTDGAALERLYAEVRIGRHVSHPNVCRLYDIVEWEGSHFISMEYIDGEDLGSLLRRIGKLPHDKALELTREICSGLAAAHALGVIHRDLKPPNIMIDGRGRARVTDFGLAALDDDPAGKGGFAGTPAYMAPEQLRGGEASQKTDLYALGLIAYEMFTGKRRFEARTSDELLEQHERSDSQSVSQHTKNLDPDIQRVIVRCLQEDPAARPASIHAVIAALPGGDPLQAAIDAGETPSPEMVAAAGASGELRPTVAVPLLVLAILLIVAVMITQGRTRMAALVDLSKRPEVLADRAREIAASAGYASPPADSFYTMANDSDWINLPDAQRIRWGTTESIRPVPLRLAYRESPRLMSPLSPSRRVGFADPPFEVPGMVRILLEPSGHLVRFDAVPPHHSPVAPAREPDWETILTATGIDLGSLRPVPPEWSAAADSDRKAAWIGVYPGQPDVPIRIEAAAYRGQPVFLSVVPPWRKPIAPAAPPMTPLQRITSPVQAVLFAAVTFLAVFLAFRNLRRDRADRIGARRVAQLIFVTLYAAQLLQAHHTTDVEREWFRIVYLAAEALLIAGLAWMFYVAVEPYLRRRWPGTLIGWSRAVSGRLADPMVGRDLLIGVTAGGFATMMALLVFRGPTNPAPAALASSAYLLSHLLEWISGSALRAIGTGVILLLFHLLFRNRIVAMALAVVAWMFFLDSPGTNTASELVLRFLVAGLIVGIYVRFGVLAAAVMIFTHVRLFSVPLTIDPSSWLFGQSLAVALAFAAIAGYGFYRSFGAQPLFARAILDE